MRLKLVVDKIGSLCGVYDAEAGEPIDGVKSFHIEANATDVTKVVLTLQATAVDIEYKQPKGEE